MEQKNLCFELSNGVECGKCKHLILSDRVIKTITFVQLLKIIKLMLEEVPEFNTTMSISYTTIKCTGEIKLKKERVEQQDKFSIERGICFILGIKWIENNVPNQKTEDNIKLCERVLKNTVDSNSLRQAINSLYNSYKE